MPDSVTYLQPSNHNGPSDAWIGAILAGPKKYTFESKSSTQVVVVATADSGYAGHKVVLTGDIYFYTPSSQDIFSASIDLIELYSPAGALISRANVYNIDLDEMHAIRIQEVYGSPGADTLAGALDTFIINGGAGDDVLRTANNLFGPIVTGGPGADTMIGLAGNDRFVAGDGADYIDGGSGWDEVELSEATGLVEIWFDQPAAPGHIRIDNVEYFTGSDLGMRIHGGARADDVNGGQAADTLAGGGGDDALGGLGGADSVAGDGGNDRLYGAEGNDSLSGGAGGDSMWGWTGDDSANGGDGDDFIRGEDGNDYLVGGAGFDDMHGNKGEDTLYGQGGHDWVVGGQGSDLLNGDADNDLMYGNMAVDTMFGGTGQDTLRGGQEGDLMLGEDGDDWLFGDRGDDTMTGGAGADIFFVTPESGSDRITDFNSAQGDRIAFEGGERQGFTLSYEGGDTVVSWSSGAKMTLVGVTQASLGTWLLG